MYVECCKIKCEVNNTDHFDYALSIAILRDSASVPGDNSMLALVTSHVFVGVLDGIVTHVPTMGPVPGHLVKRCSVAVVPCAVLALAARAAGAGEKTEGSHNLRCRPNSVALAPVVAATVPSRLLCALGQSDPARAVLARSCIVVKTKGAGVAITRIPRLGAALRAPGAHFGHSTTASTL